MFRKLLATKGNSIASLQVCRFPLQPLMVNFSSVTTGAEPGKGPTAAKGNKPAEKPINLWQKIKSGVPNKNNDTRPKFDRKDNVAKKSGQQNRPTNNNGPHQGKRQDGTPKGEGQTDRRPQSPSRPRRLQSDGDRTTARPTNGNSSAPSTSRQANNRPQGLNRRPSGNFKPPTGATRPPFRPRRAPDASSEGGSDAGSPFGGARRRRARDGDSSESTTITTPERERREIEIPDADAALLFDDDFFVDKVRKDGGRWVVDDEEADFVDHLLSKAYLESIKTSDHSFRELFTGPGFNSRFKLPKTRSMHQLRCALVPKINAAPDSEGYKQSLQAWTVLQRNNYYTDRQKRQIVNGIATMVNDLLLKSKDVNLEPIDEAIDPDYYLGPEELREEVEEDAEEVELRNKRAAAEAETRAKANAAAKEEEWNSDAVVDEDELEAINAAKK